MCVFWLKVHTWKDSPLPLIIRWHLQNCQGSLQYVTNMFKMLLLKHAFFFSNIFFILQSFTHHHNIRQSNILAYFSFYRKEEQARRVEHLSNHKGNWYLNNVNLDLLTSHPLLYEVYTHPVENTARIKIFHIRCKNAF